MTVDSSNTTNPIWRLWVIAYDNGSVQINSGDYIEVTEFQMEEGNVATPFEHRSYGEELALCQRYYQAGKYFGNSGTDLGDTNHTISFYPIVPMRAKASTTLRDEQGTFNSIRNTNGTYFTWAYGGFSHSSTVGAPFELEAGGAPFVLDIGAASAGAASWMEFYWTADAEL